ncbi:hypothetical protein EOPP23_16030 [Endozoicomonas sp. OPT23]|uniref:HAD family acid phosphatase n=1 Tax=Endozoicomonas sp. OPT23 TaxID=2072845 RepID=UPI00129ADF96|nr:HAD family acid phosphatase [Endozoicomonas sp. OPT23]MRI34496.1 hypothetical protein [Endozoicomonas sp. OPT23]
MQKPFQLLFWLLLPAFASAQSSHQPSYQSNYTQKDQNEERVIASLWQQQSPEFTALVYQTYNFASDSLPELLQGVPKNKKPAIVIDIDDTVLRSADYFSNLIDTNDNKNIHRSMAWWSNRTMPALPGAKNFLQQAHNAGVEIFYISGRFNQVKKATLKNLKAMGFPDSNEDHLLFQSAENDTLSKEGKRASIRDKGFHIVMLIGDQLEDLGPATNSSLPQKRHWLYNNQNHLGKNWFYIPNLIYGSWETTVNGNLTRPTREEQHSARLAALNNSYYPDIRESLYAQQSTSAFLWQHASAEADASALQTFNKVDQVTSKVDRTQVSNPAITITLNGSVLEYMPATPSPDDNPDDHYQWFSRLFDNSNLIAGAYEALTNAKNQGYDIFYIADETLSSMGGSDAKEKRQLLAEKLEELGLPDHDDRHIFLASDHCPSGKETCPVEYKTKTLSSGEHDAKKYTLVLQIGNLLKDFELSLDDENNKIVDSQKELFGRQLFLIPCPLHHDSLYQAAGQKLSNTDRKKLSTPEFKKSQAKLRREIAKGSDN